MAKLWKNWVLLILGFWIAVLPWLGFPRGLKDALFIISGICVVALAFVMTPRHEKNS